MLPPKVFRQQKSYLQWGSAWWPLDQLEVTSSGVCSFGWNFTERQILCSVDFHTLGLQLPFQTLFSVANELQVFVNSLENCQNFSKTSTPQYHLRRGSAWWPLDQESNAYPSELLNAAQSSDWMNKVHFKYPVTSTCHVRSGRGALDSWTSG